MFISNLLFLCLIASKKIHLLGMQDLLENQGKQFYYGSDHETVNKQMQEIQGTRDNGFVVEFALTAGAR